MQNQEFCLILQNMNKFLKDKFMFNQNGITNMMANLLLKEIF